MEIICSCLVELVVEIGLKGALILTLGSLILLAFRRYSAALRHALIMAGICVLLTLPLLRVILPPIELPIVETVPARLSQLESLSFYGEPLSPADRSAPARPHSPVGEELPGPEPPVSNRFDWKILVGLVWSVGFLVLAARLLTGFLQLRLVQKRSSRVVGERWNRLLSGCCYRLGIGRVPRLFLTAECQIPFSAGILRDSLFLPLKAGSWSMERKEIVLLHELAHSRRRDALCQIMTRLTCAIHWFNPLIWLGERQLRLEAEKACDDLVLRAGARPSRYAQHLLSIAKSTRGAPITCVSPAVIRRTDVSKRIDSILDSKKERTGITSRTLPALAATILLLLPLSALSTTAAEDTLVEEDKTSAAPAPPPPPPAPPAPAAAGGAPSVPPAPPAPPVPPVPRNREVAWGADVLVWRESGASYRVKIKDIELSESPAEIQSIGSEGYLIAEVERGETERRLELRADSSGHVLRTYSVNGKSRAWNEDAESLLRAVLSRLQNREQRIVDFETLSSEKLAQVRVELKRAREELAKQRSYLRDVLPGELNRAREELERIQGPELQKLREELEIRAPEVRRQIEEGLTEARRALEEIDLEKLNQALENIELPDVEKILEDVSSSLDVLNEFHIDFDFVEELQELEHLSNDIEQQKDERAIEDPEEKPSERVPE